MCEVCYGAPGCTVCAPDPNIECPECGGAKFTYYIGEQEAAKQEYDKALEETPDLCSFDVCTRCRGEGSISRWD